MHRNKLAASLVGLLFIPIAGVSHAQSTSSSNTSSPGTTSQDNASTGSQNLNDQSPPSSAPSANGAKQLQTVMVTGSAIPRIDLETPSPVTMISAQDIQRSGFSTVSDLLRSISADNSGSLPNSFPGALAVGASGISMRGLTVDSTLVLVDGKRVADFAGADDGERSFVDLNTLPLAAVDHIEVLKDGASSLYGADAIAGVVNIILKSSYQGVQLTADVGDSQRGGGFTKKGTLLAGTGDLNKDGYNLYVSLQVETDQSIQAMSRPFPFNTNDLSSIGGTNPNVPSSNGSIYGAVRPATISNGDILTGLPTADGVWQPLRPCGSNSTLVTNDPNNPGAYCSQNISGQYSEVQPKSNQFGLYSRLTFKINDSTKAYVSASMSQYQSWAQEGSLAQIQSTTPTNTTGIVLPWQLANGQLNPNDPFAAQQQDALISYAFQGLPQMQNTSNHNARLVGDISGTLAGWNYDASLSLNHTWLSTEALGYLNYNALYNAVVNGTYNFVNPGANSQAELNSLAPPLNTLATSDLHALDLSANHELWDLPGGTSALALGGQFRYEAQNYPEINPNNEYQNRNVVQAAGHRTVAGVYFEFDAPILESLEADLSGRFDHYSDVGNNFSPKLGLKWKPLDWLALRGTYSKGFRAPSFFQLGDSLSYGGTPYTPPASYIAAHGDDSYVQHTGVGELSVGSPVLKPEKSTSITFGVVLQPTSWLSASLDYYQIKKTSVISDPNWGLAINNYFSGLTLPAGFTVTPNRPDPNYPDMMPTPAVLTAPYVNANWLKTNGVDLDLQTHVKFDNGIQWESDLSGTEIFNWEQSYGPGQVYQFVGYQAPYVLSAGTGTPRLRGAWSNTLIYGPATVTMTARYTSGMLMVSQDVGVLPVPGSCLSTNPDGLPFPNSCWTGSFTDVDLTGSYDINRHVTVTASIFNLFNRLPPFDPANYAGLNYNPGFAQSGIVGRFFNLGVKVKF
ncbi:TonB-dependent receptor [Dyella mobilis]|uniref:TonB-dependent receptor n=1 Tax=Dyella mobilis TaxID=1849582 RepID=A0ABS2KCE0_9GAMM|nr:TonB-dependent receptor [Dyella mobilis]MBM7128853.1 TonB-dependent receptor [Dyella mobilis]GLQ99184.1 TonB system transporter [Dyella mobilis]